MTSVNTPLAPKTSKGEILERPHQPKHLEGTRKMALRDPESCPHHSVGLRLSEVVRHSGRSGEHAVRDGGDLSVLPAGYRHPIGDHPLCGVWQKATLAE